jgi:flap endonuclease-1
MMGINLRDEVSTVKKIISLDDLRGKKIGVDTFNYLYASFFVTEASGFRPSDISGNIKSHVAFFFHKTVDMFDAGIKPMYIFDGESPDLKKETIEERQSIRNEKKSRLEKAKAEGNVEMYKRLLVESQGVEQYMIDDLKELFTAFGIPWIQAKGEGEAQAAYMCAKGDIYGAASQDYDTLLFGTKIFLRNIYRASTMRMHGKEIKMEKERILLSDVLNSIGITRDQLVDVAILAGNDFNEGVDGIGIKTAIKYIKKYRDIDGVIANIGKVHEKIDISTARKVQDIFLRPDVVETCDLVFKKPDVENLAWLMTEKHGFNPSTIQKKITILRNLITTRSGKAETL